MKIRVEMLQLNKDESLFLAGRNFGSKVQVGTKDISEVFFDTETGLVNVVCLGDTAFVKGFMSFTVKGEKPKSQPKPVMPIAASPVKAQVAGPGVGLKHSAQVETPHSKPPKTIVRKAKYQGEESQGE